MSRPTVLVADDHVIVAEGLASLLKEAFDLVGIVSDGRALLEVARDKKPDVIVTDISMPLLNGLDAVRQLKSSGLPSKIIVLTQHTETHYAIEAFRMGVSGYVLKMAAREELVAAIRETILGRLYISPLITNDTISLLLEAKNEENLGQCLTLRQREVLQLIAEGKTAKEVANLLEISARTAEGHKYEIMHVLGVKTTAELVQQAIRLKLIRV